MKIIPILVLSLALSGCVLFKKPEPPIIPPTTVVKINSEALVFCALLKEDVPSNTFDDVLNSYSEVVKAYGECATRQATGVKLLKQLGNIQ